MAFLLVVLQRPCTLSHDVFQPFFSSKTITAIFTKVRPIVKFTFLRVLKSATICHTNILTNIILKSSEQINMSFSVCVFSFPLSTTSPVSSPTSTTLKESLSWISSNISTSLLFAGNLIASKPKNHLSFYLFCSDKAKFKMALFKYLMKTIWTACFKHLSSWFFQCKLSWMHLVIVMVV